MILDHFEPIIMLFKLECMFANSNKYFLLHGFENTSHFC